VEELEERLLQVEREREQAVSDLREAAARVAELDARVQAFEEAGERARAGDDGAAPSEALPHPRRLAPQRPPGLTPPRAADELRELPRALPWRRCSGASGRLGRCDRGARRTAVAEMEERRREAERRERDARAGPRQAERCGGAPGV
jgi:hypothetical protein